MAKLTKDQKESLEGLGITASTQVDAKTKLLKFLEENDVTDVEEEEFVDLLEMAQAFAPEESDDADEEGEEEEEEEEEEVPAPKKAAKAAPTKAAPVSKKQVVDEDEDDDEDSDTAAMAQAAKNKAASKPVVAKKEAKPAAKVKKAPASGGTRGQKFDPENEEHLALLKPLKKMFPESKYAHKLGKDGVTIRMNDATAVSRALFVYNGLRINVKGELEGMFNANAFRMGTNGEDKFRKALLEHDEILDRLVMEDKLPKVKSSTVEDVKLIMSLTQELMEKAINNLNESLNKNREKMEDSVKSDKGKNSKKAAPAKEEPKSTKKAKPAPEPEDEDEEEDEAPAPVAKKKAAPAPVPEPDEDDDEEVPAPTKKKAAPAPVAKKPKK